MHEATSSQKGFIDRLKTFFPPPKSLSFSSAAVDIGSGVARFISFNESSKGMTVKTWGEYPVPMFKGGIPKNEEEAIVNALIKAREEIGSAYAQIVIPEKEVYVFRVTLPRLSSKREMGSAIEFKLEESIPLPAAETLFEFDNLKKEVDGNITLSVSAAPEAYVKVMLDLLSRAGFFPVGANTEGRCLAKALTKRTEDNPVLIISVNMNDTVFVIARGGRVLFSSTTPIGRSALIECMAKSLKISTPDAVESRKNALSHHHEDTRGFFESIAPMASSLKDEVGKILVYWKTHGVGKEKWPPISKVLIVGEDALLPGFMNYLEMSVDVPVKIADVWNNAFSVDTYVPPLTKNQSLDYASLVGITI